jgi:O-antigen/teichoic acid export membrane protein
VGGEPQEKMLLPGKGDPADVAGQAGVGVTAALGQRALGGAAWSVMQALSSKGVALISQLLLAGILFKADYALVALTTLVTSLVALGQQLGIGEILVRKHLGYRRIAPAALGLSLCAGLTSVLLVWGAAPVARWAFQMPELVPLLLVASLALPFDAVAIVPQSGLRIRMQFRELALLGTANVMGTSLLGIGFALLGFGPYSLILPRVIIAPLIAAATFLLARTSFRIHLRLKLWGYFVRHSGNFLTTSLLNTLLQQGDYLLTGLLFPKEVLGAYYLAFNLSTQSVQLIGTNLASVLLPSFAKLDHDRARQTSAFVKVCTSIMLIGVPGCLLQALLAFPFFRLAFNTKWDAAIPIFQILSLGMTFLLASSPGVVMLNAQGRYRTMVIWTAVTTVSFLASVLLGALTGSVIGIAGAVACFFTVFGPLGIAVAAYESIPQAVAIVRRVFMKPLLIGAAAGAVAVVAGEALRAAGTPMLLSYAVEALVLAVAYGMLAVAVMREEITDLLARVKPLIARFHVAPRQVHA